MYYSQQELMELFAPVINAHSEDGHRLEILQGNFSSPIIICKDGAFRGSFILAIATACYNAGKSFAIGATGANEPFIQL